MKKILTISLLAASLMAQAQQKEAYLFSYFDGQKQEAGLRLAYSYDGLTWTALNNNETILRPEIGNDKLMRDPSICQGPDGTFHMVWTSSWHDRIIGYASSKDLIHWSEQQAIPVMMHEPECRNTWAPELFYDKKSRRFWIFWASTVPGAKGVTTEGTLSEGELNHRIYACTTKDFKRFSKTRLWFNPDFNAIDAAVVRDPKTGELIMAVKNENLHPEEKNIRIARSRSMKKGFPKEVSAPIHGRVRCEGPSPLFVGDDLIVYFDMYSTGRYGASISHDHGRTWEDCTSRISLPEKMNHGTAFKVDAKVVENLRRAFGD